MDKRYFEKCAELYGDTVLRIAVNYCRSLQDAEDITQEVFLRFYRKGRQLDVEQAKFYLIRMAVNLSINLTKSAWRTKVTSADSLTEELRDDTAESDRRAAVISAVRGLPVKYRSVIHLYYYEELSVREIASILKRRETTVQTQLMRARQLLKEKLGEGEL